MTSQQMFRLNEEDRYVEFVADIAVISYQIVHDDSEAIGPGVLMHDGERWIPLRDHPDAPWLDGLAERAVAAVQRRDLEACETLVERILRFGGHRERESVFVAHLLKGHLLFLSEQLVNAIACWQLAARCPSRIQATAYSNLGTAWAMARQPISAIECLDRAIAAGSGFLVPQLSRRNLAETLVNEQAPDLPGLPTWKAIRAEADERIKKVKRSEIERLLDSEKAFPTYHVMHVFEPGTYCPAISCQLTAGHSEERGARALLDAAYSAFEKEQYGLVITLAERAASMCALTKPAAMTILSVAKAKVRELEQLREATRFAETSTAFFESLQHIHVDLDAPREALALLTANGIETDKYTRKYHDAIAESLWQSASTCGTDAKRTWLLTVAGKCGCDPLAEACALAARIRRAKPFLTSFWNACANLDAASAAVALEKAESHVGKRLDVPRAVLDEITSIRCR